MKPFLSSLIVTLLVIVSCKKDHEDAIPAGEDYGCIQRVYIKAKDHSISSADVAIVDSLFSKNKIDNSKFRYYQYKRDTVSAIIYRNLVWVDQFDQNQRVFNGDQLFEFYNDTLHSVGWHTVGPNLVNASNLDTIPKMSLARVRKLFRYHLEKLYPTDNNSQRIDYSDTCFVAEFGFYKEIIDKHNSFKIYKAWRVLKKNSAKDSPAGYYDDESGKCLYFKPDL